jgi:hypothetical protein
MKRLLILTAVLLLTVSAAGCQRCQWLRGGVASPWMPTVTCYGSCVSCDPCDPCQTPAELSPTILPGPESWTPGPSL